MMYEDTIQVFILKTFNLVWPYNTKYIFTFRCGRFYQMPHWIAGKLVELKLAMYFEYKYKLEPELIISIENEKNTKRKV